MIEWKQYMLDHYVLTPKERTLLKEGPKSLAQAWHLQADARAAGRRRVFHRIAWSSATTPCLCV